MLWLLFVVYLIVRSSVEGAQRRAIVGAVYGLIAYLDIPLVYLSARLIPDQVHPADIGLSPAMKMTLGLSFIPITLITLGLISAQYRLHRAKRAISDDAEKAAAGEAIPYVSLTGAVA